MYALTCQLSPSPGVKGERPPAHEKLPDPCQRGGVLRRGRRQQQETVQEARRAVHPAGPEEASLHPGCGETQDALQETYQDHPQGTPGGRCLGEVIFTMYNHLLLNCFYWSAI